MDFIWYKETHFLLKHWLRGFTIRKSIDPQKSFSAH